VSIQENVQNGHGPLLAAPEMASKKYPIFPTTSDGKKPTVEGGFYAATTDPVQIAKWMHEPGRRWHNIAYPTGILSGVIVIDADNPKMVEMMQKKYGDPHVRSARGAHWYFKHPRVGKITSCSIAPGLDRKGDGGYVLAPPSKGKVWTNGIPNIEDLPVLPEEFWPKKREKKTGEREISQDTKDAAASAIAARIDTIKDSTRHDHMLALCRVFLDRGVSMADAEDILVAAWDQYGGELAERAESEIAGALASTQERIENDEPAKGAPYLEAQTPGLFEELEGIMGWVRLTVSPKRSGGEKRSYRCDDSGNAERLADRYGDKLRYCWPWSKWLVYDGTRWRLDDTGTIMRLAKATARSIFKEAALAEDDERAKKLSNWAASSLSEAKRKAMTSLARGEPGIPILPDALDADPYLLNCLNGTLNLRTGELQEHSPDDMISKLVPVEYDPAAKCPTFDAALARTLPSAALRGFLQRVFGLALIGEVLEQVLIILHGSGANGKSTLIEAIMAALGEYAGATAPDLLMSKGTSHPTELADLYGLRFVACMENEEGHRLNESRVKMITGRDRIKARRMREDFWEFEPTHTVVLGTNHRPEVKGTDHAIWRRVKLVPFEVTIPDSEQDKDLPAKLAAELPGILRWLVEGCLEYQRKGLAEPDEVKAATQGYRSDMDVIAQFVEDECVESPRAEAPASKLYECYRDWCEHAGETAASQRVFGLRLRDREYESFQVTSGSNKGRKGWRGIGLREDHNGPDGGPPRPSGGIKPPGEGEKVDHKEITSPAQSGLDKPNTQDKQGMVDLVDPNSVLHTRQPPRVSGYAEKRSTRSTWSTAEQQARIDPLVYEGMSPEWARREVLGLLEDEEEL
jgi:P4 family phage/plasmid primase-like protien